MGEVDSTLLLPDPLMGGYTIEHDHVHDDVPLDDDDPAGDFDPSGSLVDVESSFSPPADVTLSDAELHSDIVAQGFDAEYEPLVSNPRYVARKVYRRRYHILIPYPVVVPLFRSITGKAQRCTRWLYVSSTCSTLPA